MTAFRCPTCGAEGRFASGAPYSVCHYCKSLLVRSDVGLESIGRVAEVPDDFSPLQIGALGQFERRHFSVVGRLRKVWEQGSWNEWCVLFEDQSFGWLAEAQGDLVMTFEKPDAVLEGVPQANQAAQTKPGTIWRISGAAFSVADVKQVSCQGAEGELSEIFTVGEAVLSIDLRGRGLEFATIEFRPASVKSYLGRFVEFADCRFSNLRKLDGWDEPS
ncbi:MAG: DUF4178 domain-containing protein [Steroidobacteraceae bacterium]|jgi:hypothetical protein